MPRQKGASYPVRELRERLGLTQETFAREVGVSAMTISRWERGLAGPTQLARKQLEALERRAAREGKASAGVPGQSGRAPDGFLRMARGRREAATWPRASYPPSQ